VDRDLDPVHTLGNAVSPWAGDTPVATGLEFRGCGLVGRELDSDADPSGVAIVDLALRALHLYGGNVKYGFSGSRDSGDLDHGSFGFFKAPKQLNPRVGLEVSVLVHEVVVLFLSPRLALSRDSLELAYLDLSQGADPPVKLLDV